MPIPARRRTALRRRLLAWYDAARRALPWRFPQHGADPYRVWLAEAMLQQTQVRTVVPYYERFVARFPTLEALAAADADDVLALWSGLGYYARGRNLHAAAREALRRHGGLPASRDALAALPGFGPYTAGAVASIAFAIPAAAVDGNVARVLSRVFLVDGDPAAKAVRDRLWALASVLVCGERGRGADTSRPGDLNQALMELGATVCRRSAPTCERCPVATLCSARAAGRAREVPRARSRPERALLELACAVEIRRGAVLLVRGEPGRLLGGLWGPPAVVVAPGADPARVLAAALPPHAAGARVRVGPRLAAVTRELTHRSLRLGAYACERVGAPGPGAARWVPLDALDGVGMSAAMRALLAAALPAHPAARGPASGARGRDGREDEPEAHAPGVPRRVRRRARAAPAR